MSWAQLGAWWLTVSVVVAGCGASNILANEQQWSNEKQKDFSGRETGNLFVAAPEPKVDRYRYVLRSVRHDLAMAKNPTLTTRCRCLDVVVGRPDSGLFRWTGEVPVVSPNDTVIAVRTEGSECAGGPASTRRPSIQAVDRAGADVVVVIEELPTDRPQARGAVIPRPSPGGSLYLRPKRSKRKLVYARSMDGGAKCRVVQRSAGAAAK